jgi:hypothetical protein
MARRVRLVDLAYARSGDKGDKCNIGLMAKDDEAYRLIAGHLAPGLVKDHFGAMVRGDVDIHPMPNINAFNIVLHGALGGGATRTLRWDQTGKSMGNVLLRMELEVDS